MRIYATRRPDPATRFAGRGCRQAGTAAALKDHILRAQRAFTNRDDTEDDRTLLVLRIEGAVSAGA